MANRPVKWCLTSLLTNEMQIKSGLSLQEAGPLLSCGPETGATWAVAWETLLVRGRGSMYARPSADPGQGWGQSMPSRQSPEASRKQPAALAYVFLPQDSSFLSCHLPSQRPPPTSHTFLTRPPTTHPPDCPSGPALWTISQPFSPKAQSTLSPPGSLP